MHLAVGWKSLLLLTHCAVAAGVGIATWQHLQTRRSQVAELAATTRLEHQQLQQLQQIVGEQRAVLQGLRADDPYVVELLARERYKYRGADSRWQEIVPPPRMGANQTTGSGMLSEGADAVSAGVAQW